MEGIVNYPRRLSLYKAKGREYIITHVFRHTIWSRVIRKDGSFGNRFVLPKNYAILYLNPDLIEQWEKERRMNADQIRIVKNNLGISQ